MAITSSVYAVDSHTQIDGRRWVYETHTDSEGEVWLFSYLAVGGADYAAIMAARAGSLLNQLRDRELMRLLGGAPFVLHHQTVAELAARFRQEYRTASKERLAKLAYWLIERINDGTFTDAQVRNVFNLSVAQYSVLKARATALHDAEAAIRAAEGE